MIKYIPWFFLIPVLVLLIGLPSQLRGQLPYAISTVSYILSIFGWLFIFCWSLALNRGSSRWCRIFYGLFALNVAVNIGYKFWIGQRSLYHITTDIVVLLVVTVFFCSIPPPSRKTVKHDDVA